MRTFIAAVALGAACVSPLAAFAQDDAAAPAPSALSQLIGADAHLSIVGTDGRPVAQLIPVGGDVYRLRIIGITRGTASRTSPGVLRVDDPHALTPQQLDAAHQKELETLFPSIPFGP